MRVLLISGLLYILGIAIVLALKPAIMFTEEGGWKEFGIGRDPERFTWIPFWLFTILWAMVSFFLVQTAIVAFGYSADYLLDSFMKEEKGSSSTSSASAPSATPSAKTSAKRSVRAATEGELKPGYYMLNSESTATVPKYIYVGPEAPSE